MTIGTHRTVSTQTPHVTQDTRLFTARHTVQAGPAAGALIGFLYLDHGFSRNFTWNAGRLINRGRVCTTRDSPVRVIGPSAENS